VAARADVQTAPKLQDLCHRPAFRVYTSTDLLGVELGGALKNVIAIASGVSDGLGAAAGQGRAVLDAGLNTVAFHTRQVQQHREPGGSFDQRADRGPVQADDQVAFPVAGHRAVVSIGGSGADHHVGSDHAAAAPLSASAWHP